MNTVAFISSPAYLEHAAGLGHPESPARLAAIWEEIGARQAGLRALLEGRSAEAEASRYKAGATMGEVL